MYENVKYLFYDESERGENALLYELKGNQDKVTEHIKHIEKMKQEYKDDKEMMGYLNSLDIHEFKDILNSMKNIKGYEDTPTGFYISYTFNGEHELHYADMKEK